MISRSQLNAIPVFALSLLPALLQAEGPGEVQVQGRMLMPGGDVGSPLFVVEVDGMACIWTELDASGRFQVSLPTGVKALLRFSGAGCLEKEVLMDTHQALEGRAGDRRVRFDVRLDRASRNGGHGYTGPVGQIDFVRGSGLMKVRRGQRLAPTGHVRP